MKIIHVINSLEIGGAQRLLSDLIPLQIQQGCDVCVLVREECSNEFSLKIQSSGCEIVSVVSSKYKIFKSIKEIRKVIKDYDIVHVHLFPSLYLVALAALGLKTKLIYTEHSTSNKRREKRLLRPIEQFIYKRYTKIVSISQQTQEALQRWLNFSDSSRFVVANNGVNLEKFQSFTPPANNKSLIMISRFVAAKDHETVIKAMSLLNTDITLTLVGDGENLSNCKELASSLGLADRISFLGLRSDIPELVRNSYIGIQSSNWEGFGLTAVELMAAGKPVIASNVDGLKQVIEGAGIIFERGNHKQLAEKINLLIGDKELYHSVSVKCLKRASEYDIQNMADAYKKIYLS